MIERLFPTRVRPPTETPHRTALILWGAWFLVSIYAIATGTNVGAVLVLFAILELGGLALSSRHPFGFTFSEVVWAVVPFKVVRYAIAVGYAFATMFLVDPIWGALLLLWLVPHFVMTGAEYRKHEHRVAVLAARAYTRDTGVYPSSIEYLTATEGNAETVRQAQRLYVRLEGEDRDAFRVLGRELEASELETVRRRLY